MLRDKNLVPLSRQHQHALALCVRIERASPIAVSDLASWQEEMVEHFRSEIGIHFAAEEQVLFPAARGFAELVLVVEELIAEHGELRAMFERATGQKLSAGDLRDFAQKLSGHIRKEERVLFEHLQRLMKAEELALLGVKLEEAMKDVTQACAWPNRSSD